MSNPTVTTTFGNPDPNATPINITQLVQLLNTLVTSAIQGSYIPYIMQSDTPDVQDQDKVWMRLDSAGRPIALMKYYSGNWRRVYNGMIGEVRMYQGNPTVDFNTTGLGVIGGYFDGWALCNGNNGTQDLSDHFIAGANMNQPGNGYNTTLKQWQSKITGVLAQTGGNNQLTLTEATTWLPPVVEISLYEWIAQSNAPANPGDLYGLQNVSAKKDTLQNADPGNPNPSPIPSVNPFIALGFITFVGY